MATSATSKLRAMASPEPEDEMYDVIEIPDHVGKASTSEYFCNFVDYGPKGNCYV